MKSLIDKRFGCSLKQADTILNKDEETLRQKHVFGKESAEQLQQTVFFHACKVFGLRGFEKHHDSQCKKFKIGETALGDLFSSREGPGRPKKAA